MAGLLADCHALFSPGHKECEVRSDCSGIMMMMISSFDPFPRLLCIGIGWTVCDLSRMPLDGGGAPHCKNIGEA